MSCDVEARNPQGRVTLEQKAAYKAMIGETNEPASEAAVLKIGEHNAT